MVHLNKNQLSAKQLDALFEQLNTTLGKLSASQANSFMTELLGSEERVMLAKRLAAIILLVEGASLYKVSSTLHISSSTARQLKLKLSRGDFLTVTSVLGKNKTEYVSILETLDDILHLGGILPHYNGPDRWKHLR